LFLNVSQQEVINQENYRKEAVKKNREQFLAINWPGLKFS